MDTLIIFNYIYYYLQFALVILLIYKVKKEVGLWTTIAIAFILFLLCCDNNEARLAERFDKYYPKSKIHGSAVIYPTHYIVVEEDYGKINFRYSANIKPFYIEAHDFTGLNITNTNILLNKWGFRFEEDYCNISYLSDNKIRYHIKGFIVSNYFSNLRKAVDLKGETELKEATNFMTTPAKKDDKE